MTAQEKIDAASERFERTRQSVLDEYKRGKQALEAEYDRIMRPARYEYIRIRREAVDDPTTPEQQARAEEIADLKLRIAELEVVG